MSDVVVVLGAILGVLIVGILVIVDELRQIKHAVSSHHTTKED